MRAIGNLNRAPKCAIEWMKPVEPLYPADELLRIAPLDLRKQVDAHEIIARLVDGSEFDAFKPRYGTTLRASLSLFRRLAPPSHGLRTVISDTETSSVHVSD